MVIVESHPAVQAVLEHLLIREGYAVEACSEASEVAPGRTPVLLLMGVEDGDGLYVFQTREVAGVLAALTKDAELSGGAGLAAFGIHAFVPKPFGMVDILRVVRAVGDFDGRKKGPPRERP